MQAIGRKNYSLFLITIACVFSTVGLLVYRVEVWWIIASNNFFFNNNKTNSVVF